MKLTKQISLGNIIGASILDLPAFGSKMSRLNDLYTDDANWPNEANFAFYNKSSGNLSAAFKQFKAHIVKINIDQNRKIHLQILDM